MTPTCGAPAGQDGFVHEALIYDSDEQLLEVAVPFLCEGAAAGEPTLVAVNPRQQGVLLAALGDVRGIIALDRSHYSDPFSALQNNHRLAASLLRGGAHRIRIVGEVPGCPWPGWLRYEAAVNDLFAQLPVWAICGYDARTMPDDVLGDVERTHPYLAQPGGSVVHSRHYEQPAALFAASARADADPLEALTPDLVLVDPAAETAAEAAAMLAAGTQLDGDSADALRLSVMQVVTNAILHGRPPVRMRAWASLDRVVVKVTDAGTGPADPYVGLLPADPDADPENANALHVVHQALSAVSLFAGAEGFTVRLVERCRP
jgi:anti-sigma regulatory factor (Ser/Thr protein kinase)